MMIRSNFYSRLRTLSSFSFFTLSFLALTTVCFSSEALAKGSTEPAKASCGSTPHGGTVSQIRYLYDQVDFGFSCISETQTRTCNDGTFGAWSGSYEYSSCSVKQPLACDGQPHGTKETRTSFEKSSVAFSESCISEQQTRDCTNGLWSSWSGNYTNSSCQQAAPLNCGSTIHGDFISRQRFQSQVVPFGTSCNSEEQRSYCFDGVMSSYSGSFQYDNCSVAEPTTCEGGLQSGQSESRVRYATSTVPSGSSCSSETQSRTCTAGSLSDWSGTYAFDQCTVEVAQTPTEPEPTGINYYVDCNSGNNSNTGKSTSKAWKSLSKVATKQFNPGDAINLKRGCVWNDRLSLSTGNILNPGAAPVFIRAYGTGVNPTLSGERSLSWNNVGGNIYSATVSKPTQSPASTIFAAPEIVMFDGNHGSRLCVYVAPPQNNPEAPKCAPANVSALDRDGEWIWQPGIDANGAAISGGGGTLRVFSTTNLASNSSRVKVGATWALLGLDGVNNVYVKDLDCRLSNDCIIVNNSQNVVLNSVNVSNGAGYGGISLINSSNSRLTNVKVEKTTFSSVIYSPYHTGGSGLNMWYANGNTVESSTFLNNYGQGITAGYSANNTLRNNLIQGNGDCGIGVGEPASAGNIIEYNTVTENASQVDDRFGINFFRSGGNNIIRNNTVSSQMHAGRPGANIPKNPGFPSYYYSGAIRFDGGDKISKAAGVITDDYLESTGNIIENNTISNEYDGIQIFNYSGVNIKNNSISGTTRAKIIVGGDNTGNRTVRATVASSLAGQVETFGNVQITAQ